MHSAARPIEVRRCRLRDLSNIAALLRASWHAANDEILGRGQAERIGRRLYSRFNLVAWMVVSGLPTKWRMLVANRDGAAVGCAVAELAEEQEIVLYMLYVDPNCKGQGVGSALLDAIAASYRNAKSMRLEVLQNNTAAVDWYRAKRFEIYGETKNATGTIGVPAFYMQKML